MTKFIYHTQCIETGSFLFGEENGYWYRSPAKRAGCDYVLTSEFMFLEQKHYPVTGTHDHLMYTLELKSIYEIRIIPNHWRLCRTIRT